MAAQGQQRPAFVSPHTGKTLDAGAPEQVDQHRLGLVVRGMTGQHAGRQGGVAGGPGPGLQVGPVADVDADGSEAGPESGRGGPHDVGFAR